MKTPLALIGFGRFGKFMAPLLESQFDIHTLDPVNGVHRFHRIKAADLHQFPAVMWCTPISQMQQSMQQLAPHLAPGCTVIDTASVKILPSRWMLECLPPNCECIATHPLFGPDSFTRCQTIIMHPLRCKADTYTHWQGVFSQAGMKPRDMSPQEHDKELSLTQGLTHYIGRSLECLELPNSNVATLGYERLQQLREQTCNDSRQLFLDIIRYNPYSLDILKKVTHHQETLHALLNQQEIDHGIK